jgi:Transglutaminase-like superfamily
VFYCETQSSNTAFIPAWTPIDDLFESVLKSGISISYPEKLGFKFKEFNFDDKKIVKTETKNNISFSVENIPAYKPEDYAPSFQKLVPKVLFGLERFSLEGIEGTAKNWEDFGLWVNNNLLQGLDEIPLETQGKIKTLVASETDPVKKAKIIYKYVQDKVRYVSIQIGIGGWKPMPAKEVDRLSYGDCKALSNYTKSLLKVAGIQSYYTIIFAGENKKDIDADFVSMQGNHAILTLPINDKLCFLECTSQTTPFGFGGDFTDDRNALIIKSDKGEIIHTNEYNEKVSSQFSKGNYTLDEIGGISGGISVISKGIQFDNIFTLNKKSPTEISDHYKNRFANINNLKIVNSNFNLNNEKVEFIENLELQAKDYAEINGKKIFFAPNAFNQNQKIPQRYRNRINPLEIQRGFFDSDEIEILLPSGFSIEAKPDNFELITKFGEYKTEYIVLNGNKIKYNRSFLLKKGFYDKSEYENYRKFIEQVAQNDNSKIVITKN